MVEQILTGNRANAALGLDAVQGKTHTVTAADGHLTRIAEEHYGVSRYNTVQINTVVAALADANHLTNANQIFVGQKLILPAITIPETGQATRQQAVIVQQAVVLSTEVYSNGTAVIAGPEMVSAEVVEVSYMSWHIDRNRGMVCPTQIPEDGDNWRHIPIDWNLVEIYFHGLGNVDVRGLGENAGVQCIYTPEGELVTGVLAGTRDFAPPVDPNTGAVTAGRVWRHTWLDVVPEFFFPSTQPGVAE